MPRLASDAAFVPVEIDHYGFDWIEGPRKALVLALAQVLDTTLRQRLRLNGLPSYEQALEALEYLGQETGRTPVLLFDQFDDYHTRHRALFVRGRSKRVLTPEKLIAQNSFWADIARLLNAGRIRCLFAVREDAPLALDSVLFSRLPDAIPSIAWTATTPPSYSIRSPPRRGSSIPRAASSFCATSSSMTWGHPAASCFPRR